MVVWSLCSRHASCGTDTHTHTRYPYKGIWHFGEERDITANKKKIEVAIFLVSTSTENRITAQKDNKSFPSLKSVDHPPLLSSYGYVKSTSCLHSAWRTWIQPVYMSSDREITHTPTSRKNTHTHKIHMKATKISEVLIRAAPVRYPRQDRHDTRDKLQYRGTHS